MDFLPSKPKMIKSFFFTTVPVWLAANSLFQIALLNLLNSFFFVHVRGLLSRLDLSSFRLVSAASYLLLLPSWKMVQTMAVVAGDTRAYSASCSRVGPGCMSFANRSVSSVTFCIRGFRSTQFWAPVNMIFIIHLYNYP